MIPYNGFILSIVLMLFGVATPPLEERGCQAMDATVKVSAIDQGLIEILGPSDAKLKVYMLLLESSDPPQEVELTNGQLRQVAPGQYDVILQDTGRKYCLYTQRVTVN